MRGQWDWVPTVLWVLVGRAHPVEARPLENLARLTPPYHFVPNPRFIEGWHFRNSDNTGPNEVGEKNVNAPQRVRDFIFSPMVGKTVEYPPGPEAIKMFPLFSREKLVIQNIALGRLEKITRAVFKAVKFQVEIALSE